jgi:hypothetical protein
MKKGWKPSFSKTKLVQYSEVNEENGYPDPDSNKAKINYTKEHKEVHKNTMKEESLNVINENFIEMLLDMFNQNIQEALKKFKYRGSKMVTRTATDLLTSVIQGH